MQGIWKRCCRTSSDPILSVLCLLLPILWLLVLPHRSLGSGPKIGPMVRLPSAAWGLIPLGARLRPDEILDRPTRRKVYLQIRSQPGICYRQLLRAVPMANGTLEFHLAQLERSGLVLAFVVGRRTHLYPNDSRGLASELPLGEQRQRILEHLRQNPGASTNDLRRAIDISQSTVSYHLVAMRSLGLVTAQREGHALHWCIAGGIQLSKAVPQAV